MKPLQTVEERMAQPSTWGPIRAPGDREALPLGRTNLGAQRLGDELKSLYGGVTASPLPDRLQELADALDEAFTRGDLFDRRRCS